MRATKGVTSGTVVLHKGLAMSGSQVLSQQEA